MVFPVGASDLDLLGVISIDAFEELVCVVVVYIPDVFVASCPVEAAAAVLFPLYSLASFCCCLLSPLLPTPLTVGSFKLRRFPDFLPLLADDESGRLTTTTLVFVPFALAPADVRELRADCSEGVDYCC